MHAARRAAARRRAEKLAGTRPIVYSASPAAASSWTRSRRRSMLARVLVVRKLGYPGHEEAGFGAVGEEGGPPPSPRSTAAIRRKRGREARRSSASARRSSRRACIPGRERIALAAEPRSSSTTASRPGTHSPLRSRSSGPRTLDRLIGAAPVASGRARRLAAGYCDELIPSGRRVARCFSPSACTTRISRRSRDAQVIELLGPARGIIPWTPPQAHDPPRDRPGAAVLLAGALVYTSFDAATGRGSRPSCWPARRRGSPTS